MGFLKTILLSFLPSLGVTVVMASTISQASSLEEQESAARIGAILGIEDAAQIDTLKYRQNTSELISIIETFFNNGSNPHFQLRLLQHLSSHREIYRTFTKAIQDRVAGDSRARDRLRQNLERLDSIRRKKKVRRPNMGRCSIAVSLYLGTRGLAYGFQPVEEGEVLPRGASEEWQQVSSIAHYGMLGVTALWCIGDAIVAHREIPLIRKEILTNFRSETVLNELIHAQKAAPSVGIHTSQGLHSKTLTLASQKGSQTVPKLFEYLLSSGVARVRAIGGSISDETKSRLVKLLRGYPIGESETQELEKDLSRIEMIIRSDFRSWIQSRGRNSELSLLEASFRIEEESDDALRRVNHLNPATRACFYSLGFSVALMSYGASIGEKNELDRNLENVIREHFSQLIYSAASVIAVTCGAQHVLHWTHYKDLERKTLGEIKHLSQKEWFFIRDQIIRSAVPPKKGRPSNRDIPAAEEVLKEVIEALESPEKWEEFVGKGVSYAPACRRLLDPMG